jgi:Protein of unknown function (DUF2561)
MAVIRQSARSPDSVDRALVGACALIWLAVIGVGVAATVVLVDLGSGRHRGSGGGSHTPWLLYAVIAVSAVVIVGAMPLLVRARRGAVTEPAREPVTPPGAAQRQGESRESAGRAPGAPGAEAPTQKLRAFDSIANPIDRVPRTYRAPERPPRRPAGGLAEEAVERLWLRATVAISGAMGVAMLAVTTATYLMGVAKDSPAWVAYGFAAAVTVAMPIIPWLYLRALRSTIGARSGYRRAR